MDKEDVDKVLAGRVIVDKHRNRQLYNEKDDDHDKSTQEMYDGLAALGFKSFEEFETNNELANYDEWKSKSKIEGDCDFCEGYEGTPPCVLRHADHACFYNKMTTESIYRMVYKWRYKDKEIYSGDKASFVTNSGVYRGCPEGHGWHFIDFDKRVFDFDIDWHTK